MQTRDFARPAQCTFSKANDLSSRWPSADSLSKPGLEVGKVRRELRVGPSWGGPFFSLANPSMSAQRLDLDTRGGERSAPIEHDRSLKISELESVGTREDLAVGGGLERPGNLNGGFTNILAWEK